MSWGVLNPEKYVKFIYFLGRGTIAFFTDRNRPIYLVRQ